MAAVVRQELTQGSIVHVPSARFCCRTRKGVLVQEKPQAQLQRYCFFQRTQVHYPFLMVFGEHLLQDHHYETSQQMRTSQCVRQVQEKPRAMDCFRSFFLLHVTVSATLRLVWTGHRCVPNGTWALVVYNHVLTAYTVTKDCTNGNKTNYL